MGNFATITEATYIYKWVHTLVTSPTKTSKTPDSSGRLNIVEE
jgi:hypothetical protein